MPLDDKQKAWLQRHLGVETGIKAKISKGKRTKEYTAFFDKKKELLDLAVQLKRYDFAQNRAKVLNNKLEAADDRLHRQAEGDLESALKDSLKELASLKSQTNSDLKSAKNLETRIGVVRGNGKLIMASPSEHKELLGISVALRSAVKTAENGDFAQAYKDLAAVEKSSSVVAKLAATELAEKKEWDLREADVKTCVGILEVMKPHADPTILKNSLEAAQKDAGDKNFKTAFDGLKDYKKIYDAEYKLAKGKQQADVDNLAKADLVNDRIEAINLLLVQVATLPGLTSWIEAKETALKMISPGLTDVGKYADGWKKLEKDWSLAKLKKDAESTSASQSKKALKNPDVKQANANIQKDLTALQDLFTEDTLAGYRQSLARGMDVYISVANNKKAKNVAIEDAGKNAKIVITKLNTEIDKETRKLVPLKKACEDHRSRIEEGLKTLADTVSNETRARSGLEWERLSAALAVKEFEKSLPKLKELLKQINELLEKSTRERQVWEEKLAKLETVIPANLEKVGGCPVTSDRASGLKSEWVQLKNLAQKREPGEATEGVQSLMGSIDIQLELVKQYDALDKARKAANLKVQSELKMAEGEIEKLKTAVSKVRGSNSSAEPAGIAFEDDHKRLTIEWEGDMKGAYKNEKELNQKTEEVISKIAEMLKAIEAAASNPKAISKIASSQESDEKRLEYLKKVDGFRAKLEELADMDGRASVRLEKELTTIDKTSTDDYDKAIKETGDLHGQLIKAIEHAENVHKNTLESVKLTAEATRKKVAETEKGLGSSKEGFKDFFANLRSLIDDMEKSLMASSSFAVLMTANHEFNEILRPMYQIVDDAKKGGKDKLDYSSVFKTVEAQSKYLNSNTNLDSCQPTMKNLLTEKFSGIQTAIKAQSPREATATLAAFQKELDEIKVKADFAMSKRTTFMLNAKTAKAKLKKLDQKLDYTHKLEAKLKGLEGVVTAENKEETAARDLVLLLVEVDHALNDPDYALEQEMAVRTAELETEQKRKEWEANLKAFDSVMADVNKAMKKAGDDADLTQVRELESMRKESKSIAKGEDYVTALKKLDLTRRHAIKVIANPVGEKVTSRNSLPKDLTRYQTAVKGFNQFMKDLSKRIDKEGENVKKDALKTAKDMLDSMQFEFDTKVFDKAVELLSNKKADTSAKRAAREQVLSTVRSYQTRLDKGPLMLKVLLAPFKPDARAAFDGVRISLNSLDVNVRRCV